MEKIVIANDSTFENVKLNFRHLLPGSEKIAQKQTCFKPLENATGGIPEHFFPSALISGSVEEALKTLTGKDELELFFMILLENASENSDRNISAEMLKNLKSVKEKIDKDNYLNLLIFMLAEFGNTEGILTEIREHMTDFDPVAEMLLSFYDASPRNISDISTPESFCAAFFEAIKAEKLGDYDKAFSLMLKVFDGSDLHPFIFEILKFYIMQYSGISPEHISEFTKKVTESSLAVSFTTVKFVEFCHYYKNNVTDKLEQTVSTLAENTDSVFILNILAPVLYKYKKWDLVGKFYKLSSKKAVGAEKTVYLELLADLYENKLEIPDFAAEIYQNIADEDPINCTFSLSKALEVYEENESWEKLVGLYSLIAERENNPLFQATFFSKAGEIFLRRLNDPEKAAEYFEKSLAAKYSFETAKMLAGLCIGAKNYDRCIEILTTEFENATEKEEKIRILKKLADCRVVHGYKVEESEKYLLKILEIDPKNLEAVKKLGMVYSAEKNWEKLVETNFKEIDLSKNINEIASLYYKNGVIFYEELKDMTRAAECFRELLEITPDHLPTLFYLEKIYSKTKNRQNIAFVVSQISELAATPQSKMALSYQMKLAMLFRDSGNSKAANKIFSEILESDPENITAKENLRMSEGKADFTNIETELIDYNEYNFELFVEYIKQNDLLMMTDEILKREPHSFWRDLYFFYKEGEKSDSKESYSDKERFIFSLFDKDFFVNILIKNSNKKIALMFLAGEYIKAGFFDGVSILLDYHLKFEPKNKRKIWSLFFRGCENPNLQEELEELFTTTEDKDYFKIIQEILEHLYIKNKDIDTLLFVRNVVLQKIEDNKEKCKFIDETISMTRGEISNDKLTDIYKKRIKYTDNENLSSFLKESENLERYIDILASEGKFNEAEKSILKFTRKGFDQTILSAKVARSRKDYEKENSLLKSLIFEAVSQKATYPLNRLIELNESKKHFTLFLKKALDFIEENKLEEIEPFPNLFAPDKKRLFEFATFSERDDHLREFVQLASSVSCKIKITANPLSSSRHRTLIQIIEYIKLSCNFDELEGLWDEESADICKPIISQTPCIVFSPASLKIGFEKLKFMTLRKSFLLSCGLENTLQETAEKIFFSLRLAGKEKVKFVKSIRPTFQNRVLELMKMLENTEISEIRSYLAKLNEASLWHAFYFNPDVSEIKDFAKAEKFIDLFFL